MKNFNKLNLLFKQYGQKILFLAIIFYLIIFGFISLWKYYNFYYNAMDLGIINQVFYNSAQGDFFTSSIHPPNYLGDHFTPILFLLLPFYLLWQAPPALLILQTLFLALAAWPIYLITKKILGSSWAVVFALAWLINPFVQNINLFEFSFLPVAIFFLFWTFYFYQQKKLVPFLIFALLSMLVREDVALVIFMFGILAIFEKRKINFWLWPIILSIIYFIAAIIITGFFAPGQSYKFLIYYSWLGTTPLEIIKNTFLKPGLIIAHLIKWGNLEFILGLLLPFVFLPLISPWYLLLSLGIFIQLILGSTGWSVMILQTHYCSLLLPAVFLSAIYSIKKISLPDQTSKLILLIKNYQNLALIIFLTGLVYSSLTLGPILSSLNKIRTEGFLKSESVAKHQLLAKIPKTAWVSATYDALTPLSSRQNISSFNYIFLGKQQFLAKDYPLPAETEYLVIDFSDLITYQVQYGKSLFFQNQYQAALLAWPKILTDFGLIEIDNLLALYQKGAADKFNLIEDFSQLPDAVKPMEANFGQNLKLIGFAKKENQYQFFWQLNSSLKKPYCLKFSLADGKNIVWEKIYPFAYDLLINSNKKNIQTNYWFELPKNISPGAYELKLSLIEIEQGGIEIDPIRSTQKIIDKKIQIGAEISLETINL